MEKIKVYIQYPWKVSDSLYYKTLLENPPSGIEYLDTGIKKGMITNKKNLWISNISKKSIRKFLGKISLNIPNIIMTKSREKRDLIHCAHCLSLNKEPWVGDFEHVFQMWISQGKGESSKKRIRKLLLGNNCKKIIAWTGDVKENILEDFPEIRDKIEIVPFAMRPIKVKKIKTGKMTLLFVARYFYNKGGLHSLETFDRLTKKYDHVEAIVVSPVPKDILRKYSRNKKIKFFDLIPQEKLFKEIYSRADILIYPGYSDTFGFSLVEALAFGIPVVTVDGFARKDVIDDGKTGFIVDCPANLKRERITETEIKIIEDLEEGASKLIENKRLLNKMSKNCKEVIKNGKFSIGKRNRSLKKVYQEALK